MEKTPALLDLCAWNSPLTGEFPAQRPVTRSFDVFFDLRLNKRLSKQTWGWWFETPSCLSWLHCNAPRESYNILNMDPNIKIKHNKTVCIFYGIYRMYSTQCCRVTECGDSDRDQHWFRKWLVDCSVTSHYLSQWWLVDSWTHRNRQQGNIKQHITVCIQGN